MTIQADYTPDEWQNLVHAPAQASMLIVNADKTGGITGQFGIVQEMRDARAEVEKIAGTTSSGFVKELAHALIEEKSWKPLMEHATPETITKSLERVSSILATRATPDDAQAYKQYIYGVARRTASASKESGETQTSEKEKAALQQIAGMLELHG